MNNVENKCVSKFRNVLKKCHDMGASDVHICVGAPWRFRLDGQISTISNLPPLTLEEGLVIIKHILLMGNLISSDLVGEKVLSLKELDCSYSIPGVCRYRVNICRQRGTYALVLRMIPFDPPTIEELNFPEVIRTISHEPRGLVLVTGITGSGKTTTLAAMIDEINNHFPQKIVTIEDPIEFLHKDKNSSIIQREVGGDTDTFANALRSSLRQDPDCILVGEIRDKETVDIALKAAETGHLVLSSLHTTDAPKTIRRMMSLFEAGEQKEIRSRLAEALKAVISQRLLRRCDQLGRIAVVEVMRQTLAIQDAIEYPEKGASIKDYISRGRKEYGMQTFDQHIMELFKAGIIDKPTAKTAATSPADFERALNFD
ncbi:MAG: PilT/PilU family type 4a pilus ATPase [Acidobacteriota bacterium]